MKGAGTLALLVLLAVAAGLVIAVNRPAGQVPADDTPRRPAAELRVEDALGLPFKQSPPIEAVAPEVLLEKIGAMLDAQFGPGGLTRRTRAYELLGLLPPDSNLRREMIAAQAAGIRGWFDPRSGRILVPEDFQPGAPHDRVALHGLLARALAHQHAPTTTGTVADDEWFARRSVYQAIGATVENALRKADPEPFRLPAPYETERETVILGLPLIVHNLAQFSGTAGQARVFVETRLETGTRAAADLIRDPPRSTFEILGGDPAAIDHPELPALGQLLLEESVGALGVQTLIEWLDDFEQARTLALLWRGDRYRLFADTHGDHLLWICDWHSPEAARRAADILGRTETSPDPASIAGRQRTVVAEGARTVVADCAGDESLAAVLQKLGLDGASSNPDSPPPPAP